MIGIPHCKNNTSCSEQHFNRGKKIDPVIRNKIEDIEMSL
jgi:hypothetical protein